MPKYIEAVSAATIIAEKHGTPIAELVDTFAEIPDADVAQVRQGKRTIRERFEAAFPRCRIDEYGEPAEICPASLAGKECPATDKPTCMNCPAWDWPAE